MTIDQSPPRRFLPIESACQIVTDGGTPRALAAADMFLRAVAGSQGITDPRLVPHAAAGRETERVRLRWWQATPHGPLFLHMADVRALQDRFHVWIADAVPLDERTAEVGSVVKAAASAPRYRQDGPGKCRSHLVDMMTGQKPSADMTKAKLRPQLTAHFKISGRQHDEAWRRAVEDSGAASSWGKAGKRPKKS
jgi:hypothetical protein